MYVRLFGGKAEAIQCSNSGEFAAHVIGSAMLSIDTGKCAELCLSDFTLSMLPGAQRGGCADAGYGSLLREENVQPTGAPFPFFIRVFQSVSGSVPAAVDVAGSEQAKPVDPMKEGWCETLDGQGTGGRTLITCYSQALEMFPGQVINSNYVLPNPFKKEVAIYRRGAWMVDANLNEVSLGT